MNLKKLKLQHLWDYLDDLQDTRAGQHTALLEFKHGDYYGPTAEQLRWAKKNTKQILYDIDDVMCEIERREPGTFTTYTK